MNFPGVAGGAAQLPVMINLTDGSCPDYISTQLDYRLSDRPFAVTHFILECGRKLEADCLTICTAASLFHKFCAATNIADYDPYLIGTLHHIIVTRRVGRVVTFETDVPSFHYYHCDDNRPARSF